jgi:putative hemolysin
MDSHLMFELAAILLLVLANGFFALAEFSIIASRPSRLSQKRRQRMFGAWRAEKIRSKPESFLASIQVGITLVGALLGVLTGANIVEKIQGALIRSGNDFFADSAKTIAVVVVVVAITVLSVVVGELVPKYLALSYPERYARLIATPADIFIKLTAPFSRLLSMTAELIVRALGVKKSTGHHHLVTEDEINQMILDGRHRGVFEPSEQQFIRSVFEFTDGAVSRALTPRTDVVAFEKQMSVDRIKEIIRKNGYSRYPVYERTIDNVVGIIFVKDLVHGVDGLTADEFEGALRDPMFVPDSMPLPRLLQEFQKGKNHMAIVLDEFGGTAGLITLEDVLEELVGEIQDEYDTETAPVVRHSDTIVFARGEVWPGEINEVLETHLPEDDIDTLAGLFMGITGRLPDKHESIVVADVRMTILAKDENRILRLKLERLDTPGTDGEPTP